MSMTADAVIHDLARSAHAESVPILQRFFKTSPGQYGEGDMFIGVKMPPLRQVCKQFCMLPFSEVQKLLNSKIHEHRMAGAVILCYQYPKVDHNAQRDIYNFYLKNVYDGNINNWDLVDVTCRDTIGRYLFEHNQPRDVLFTLARSRSVWQRRVGIISSFYFFKNCAADDVATIRALCKVLLYDRHDLIQKAVGWTLRELGKRAGEAVLTEFLDEFAADMPRTTLRYAIERLPAHKKQVYMAKRAR